MQIEISKGKNGNYWYMGQEDFNDYEMDTGVSWELFNFEAFQGMFVQAAKEVMAENSPETENDENLFRAAEDWMFLNGASRDGKYDFPKYNWDRVNWMLYS